MPYVAPSTVVAGQTYSAAAHNVIVNDVIDLNTRLQVVTSSTRPGSPTEGMFIYETDTNKILVYDGAAWDEIHDLDNNGSVSDASLNYSPQSVVTSLPGSPVDGQVIYYNADSTNGVIWQLRYRSASSSAYKWEFVGGGVLYQRDDNDRNTFSSTYQTTGSPTITLPLAGDYELQYGATRIASNSASSNSMLLGLHVNAVLVSYSNPLGTASGQSFPSSNTFRHNGATAGHVADVRYRSASSLSSNFERMFLSVRPVRVG